MRVAVFVSLFVTASMAVALDGPVGRIVYRGLTDGAMLVYAVDADGGRHTELAENWADPLWLPDGSGVVINGKLVDTDTGAFEEFTPEHGVKDISPDGEWYAILGPNRVPDAETWEVVTYRADGSEYRVLTEELDLGRLNNLEWSPDGRSLLVAAWTIDAQRTRIHVVDAEGGGAVAMLPDGEEGYDAHWSADGASIYYKADPGGLRRIDVADRSIHVIDDGWGGRLFAVSPDGKYLLSARVWDHVELAAFDLNGAFVSRITHHEAFPRAADWFIPGHLAPVSPVRTRAVTWAILREGVD
ncbi:hypothetical protein CMK11_20150 [Candidatus Poribacteria bacterium]|nr:hypothetical protein [Candidatus Poribacteria bacterium]